MAQKTIRLGPDGFETTDENEADVRDVFFAGRWSTPPIPDNRQALHLLDLQPNEGEFACWAYMRFGGPWIDCVLSQSEPAIARQILTANLPPSARIVDKPEAVYDVIHAGECVEEGLAELERCTPAWYGAEWNSGVQRRAIDAACAKFGLRLFRTELRDADTGRGLWIRSNAVWVDGSYRLKAA